MDDDPVQFTFVVVIGELFRIGAYGIEADEEVTAKAVAFTVVESDDICVIIVLQILAVHFEYLLVRAEDVGDFTDSFSVSGGYGSVSYTHLDVYKRQELAYKIVTNDTYPSWGYMIKKGATTICVSTNAITSFIVALP